MKKVNVLQVAAVAAAMVVATMGMSTWANASTHAGYVAPVVLANGGASPAVCCGSGDPLPGSGQ